MDNLKTALSSIKFLEDEDIRNEVLPKLIPLLQAKQDITQESLFTSLYEDFIAEDINYKDIVTLFQDMFEFQFIRHNRKKYLLYHWLYYQTFKVMPTLNQQGVMSFMKNIIQKKQQVKKTIDNISQRFQFNKDVQAQFKQNIQKNSIYDYLAKLLTPSTELNPQKIEEKHKELLYIIQKMSGFGESVEYQLQKHIIVSFEKAYGKNSNKGGQLANNLKGIKQIEALMYEQHRINQKMKGKFSEFKMANNDKTRYNILEGIKSQLTVVDVFLLDHLISLSKNNSQENGKKAHQEIILFVGPSGSGKTTIILRVLGYKLVQTEISQLSTLQPVDLRQEHSALRTSPESTSTTRYMFSAKIPKQSFRAGSYEDLSVCDSPGFEDSAGCEVDISNSISIQTFIKTCTSVKLVVVISQRKVGDKMEGIRDIAKIVSNLVVKYSQIDKDVSIVLNKFECQKEYARLRPGIQSILSSLTPAEQSNKEYVSFLYSLLKRLKLKNPNVVRFDPSKTDIQDFVQELKEGKIMNPRELFRYSLSPKSSQCINNRKTILTKLIKESIGKDNNLALYYLKQLTLLSKCLNEQPDIEEQIKNIKKNIQKQVYEKFKVFQKRIEDQILSNDSNNNTFRELNKIKDQVKSYEIFGLCIEKLITTDKLQKKIIEVKTKLLQDISRLQFSQQKIQESKKKVINTIKFLGKSQIRLQRSVIDKLTESFASNKRLLSDYLNNQKYHKLRAHTIILKNMFEVMEKGREAMVFDQNNPQTAFIDKKQFQQIVQIIKKSFQKMAKQSTNFILSFKQNSSKYEISAEQITKINKNIKIFQQIEIDGAILNEIYARDYKNEIIQKICSFGKQVIEQLNRIVDPNSKSIDESKTEYLKQNKINTKKLKQIYGVYGIIGEQIQKLWSSFQRFISISTKRLNDFLSDLKNDKKINKKTLKEFKSMIDKIIQFSQGDNDLFESISQLKMEIKKSIGEHITNLKNKIDKVKITLKLKRTLDFEELNKLFEKFKQIEAFYQTKQLKKKNYLGVNNNIMLKPLIQNTQQGQKLVRNADLGSLGKISSTSKGDGGDDDEDDDEDDDQNDDYYEDINIKQLIKQMYNSTLDKLFNPFKEITTQTEKAKEKNIKYLTSNYLQMLNEFLQYKKYLQENDIHLNRNVQKRIKMFQQSSFLKNITQMITDIKQYFDQIQNGSIEQESPIYKLQVSRIKDFKKLCTTLLIIKKNFYLQDLFLDHNFCCQQYIEKMIAILHKSQQLIKGQLADRNKSNIDYTKRLLQLKTQIEEMIIFDQFQFQKGQPCAKFNFATIYEKIINQVKGFQSKQSSSITYLFKDQTIILSQVKKMYELLKNDLKNEDNLNLISNNLKNYGDKLKKQLFQAKQLYKNDETMNLDNQNANHYFAKLEKLLKIYQELRQFMDQKFFHVFTINQNFFNSEISDLQVQEKLKYTYQMTKEKLEVFEFKTKQRQFDKIISIMKKAEYIIDKIAKDDLYSQLYQSIQKEEEFNFGNKFSERLKYFWAKSQSQVKTVVSNQNNDQKIIQMPNFVSMYNNLSQKERQILDTKIQIVMQQKLENLEKTYGKSDEQKKIVEEQARKILDKLPNKARTLFRHSYENTKSKLREKQENELRSIKRQLNSSSKNVFQSIIKLEQCKNLNVEKELKNIIGSQLKMLVKEITVIGNNKRMVVVQSFKRYLKYFGSKNQEMIQKTKNNDKIKNNFFIEQKTFLNDLISEQREIIREIDSELTKCSIQGYNNFNKKCNQMNELYVLVIEDQYQGMCKLQRQQILTLWQQYTKKIIQKIQSFASASQISITTIPASKTEKIIIQLKYVRQFINNHMGICKKIAKSNKQRYQFIQQVSKKFQQITIDHDITKQIAKQINQLLKEVQKINFYDDQIKILNFASLEVQFEKKLINFLKLLQEYQELYNKYLCQREQDKYSKKNLIEIIQGKWQQNIKMATKQFQLAITYPQEQISQRILTLHNLTQIVTNKRWDVVDKQLKSRENLQNFLDSKFSQIKQWFTNDLARIQNIIDEKSDIYKNFQDAKLNSQAEIDDIQKRYYQTKQQLEKSIQQTIDQEAKQKLNLKYQNIQSFKNEEIQNIKTTNYNAFLAKKNQNDQSLKIFIETEVVKHLIIMKKVIHSVHWKLKDNQTSFIQFLQQINKQSKNINKIIFENLSSSSNSYALIIAAQSDIFKSQAAAQFKNKTSKQGIEYILDNCDQLKADKQLKQDVYNFYNKYQQEYNKIIESFKNNPDKQQINIVAKKLRDVKDKNQNRRYKDNMPPAVIIAEVFAIWSMSKVDLSDKENISIDFQPHPAQIVAIFLLIGLNDSQVKNSLIEVLTGEGKSIVLAGLCIYLALKGYRPYCACYSQYLSSRDEKEFKELFEILDISSKIKYGTFNQHCEDIINESPAVLASRFNKAEENKTFRSHMKSVIMGKLQKNTTQYFLKIFDQRLHKMSRRILIIDEADVFFNENFFGRLYCPSLSLDDQETKKLIAYIWSVTKSSRQDDNLEKIQLYQIYESNQFKTVVAKYPAIKDLIKNQVIGMLQAVYNYHHGYIIHQDSIKYRDNDSITDKISYGYKTVFANCFEYQRKAISQISYNSALKITLNIAPFSYSQLPTFFQAILGVSGTVSSMSDYKRQMLRQRYGIEETYEIPSIYGATQRMKDNFTIVRDEVFYDRIVKNVEKIQKTKRPVALFFKTIKDVINFYKSPQFKQLTASTTILTEQTDSQSRQIIIKRVGQRGKITILTESFARGTDFKIFDKTINDIGGLHVIQTFISSDLSEYIQTRGRTARQGGKGSFQVLVNETQLQKFQLICSNDSQFQQKMKKAWIRKDSDQCELLRERVEKARQKHLQTQSLFKKRSSLEEIISFIYSHNKFNQIRKNNVRTLIGIDGTASMGLALQKVFSILEDCFVRTKIVLQKKKVAGSFENQIGIYRNYDSDFERLLQFSGFQADSQKLKQFLQNIQVNGGWGNEAMQVLFQHANKMKKLDQIIIIADARANGIEQTKKKRSRLGQNYWVTNGFPMTNETEQVLKLKQKKIKIHTLYINLETSDQLKKSQLKKYCQNISIQTGGASQQLKLKDINVSQALTGFLVKNILMLIGGQKKGRELAASYDQDFAVPLRL